MRTPQKHVLSHSHVAGSQVQSTPSGRPASPAVVKRDAEAEEGVAKAGAAAAAAEDVAEDDDVKVSSGEDRGAAALPAVSSSAVTAGRAAGESIDPHDASSGGNGSPRRASSAAASAGCAGKAKERRGEDCRAVYAEPRRAPRARRPHEPRAPPAPIPQRWHPSRERSERWGRISPEAPDTRAAFARCACALACACLDGGPGWTVQVDGSTQAGPFHADIRIGPMMIRYRLKQLGLSYSSSPLAAGWLAIDTCIDSAASQQCASVARLPTHKAAPLSA